MNGGGDCPLSARYWYPCQGQVTQPSTMRPSASGPPWCAHTPEIALNPPAWRKTATVRAGPSFTAFARPSSISPTSPTRTQPSAASARRRRSVRNSFSPAARWMPTTHAAASAVIHAYPGQTASCSAPNATCATISANARYTHRCSAFHVRGERLRSQKSWLVAAIANRMTSAASPSGWNGTCAAPSNGTPLDRMLVSGSSTPKPWYQTVASSACASAIRNIVTPRCRRL